MSATIYQTKNYLYLPDSNIFFNIVCESLRRLRETITPRRDSV